MTRPTGYPSPDEPITELPKVPEGPAPGAADDTVYARVVLPSFLYRRLKAAAALRGVGVGDLIRQILAEHVEDYLKEPF
jgi:hypothetical protein